jgi:hypothetical protein
MSQTTGLTTLSEEDIARHRSVAQSMVTRVVVLVAQDGSSSTPLAGTNRRFVSTVSTSGMRRTREIEFGKTIQSVRANDQMLSIPQHTLLFRTRRGLAVALAVAEMFSAVRRILKACSRATQARRCRARRLSASSGCCLPLPMWLLSALAAYILQTVDGESEPANDTEEPDFPVRHAAGCAEVA